MKAAARLFAIAVLLTVMPVTAWAQVEVDLELVLLADATGSIDEAEIRFQRQGYADAIVHPEVISAIKGSGNGRIAVTYVEWGHAASQHVVVGWTVIDSEETAAAFASALALPPRLANGGNAIGAALLFGKGLIETNYYDGLRKVIDLSADSAANFSGPPIEVARDAVIAAGITINGLAVLCRGCSGQPINYDLEEAFRQRLIGGNRAFVVTAENASTFTSAVRRKLILEIAGRPEPDRRFAAD
ncbi:MAG: DUF1194 domain-containing protein [Rhodobiaceae bacterium]|nr:DUF1194 domain-containing protein [Rhodobiaceae bacterium]MCC0055928.1 DUF1194 domain-containing protein [Rhodobiaceae bacterium]